MAMHAAGSSSRVGDDRRITGCALDQTVVDRIGFVAHETSVAVTVRTLLVGGTPVVMVGVRRWATAW